jgi:hypothetical protein
MAALPRVYLPFRDQRVNSAGASHPPGVLSIADDAIEQAFLAVLHKSGGVQGLTKPGSGAMSAIGRSRISPAKSDSRFNPSGHETE